MKAGFARHDITPPLGTPLLGTGLATQRLCDSVNDPTYARALWLEHEGQRALFVGLDLCFIGRAEGDRIKAALHRELGLSAEQVLLNCSHTHAAAAASRYYDMAEALQPLEKYLDQLEPAVVRAAKAAREARRDVRLRAAMGRTDIPMNRRRPRKGTIVNAPNPGGTVLGSLPVCIFEDSAGQVVCLLFAASTHPVCMRSNAVSADYPGAAMQKLDEYGRRPCSLFLQGAGCGNSRPAALSLGEKWNFDSTWSDARAIGERLARETLAATASASPLEPHLRVALTEARFPFAALSRADYQTVLEEHHGEAAIGNTATSEDYIRLRHRWAAQQLALLDRQAIPSELTMRVQGIQLADGLRLVALECEPMAEHGHAIERTFDGITFAVGYSNGDGIYLVTSPMLDEGGYEVDSYWEYGHPAPLAAGMEKVLADAVQRLRDTGIA